MTALPEISATDHTGRRLQLRSLDLIEEFDLIEAAGVASETQRWMMLATFAACVRSIDDIPCVRPTTKALIRQQVQKVGSAGMRAVVAALSTELPEGAAALVDGAAREADAAKN